MTEQDFVAKLSAYRGKNVFNPWGESDALHDIGAAAPIIRRMNLAVYMGLRPQVDYIFMGEAPGYQGGHFSGIAFTSERILLGYHEKVRPQDVLKYYIAKRTSDPKKCMGQKVKDYLSVAKFGFNEPSATIVWSSMLELGFDSFRVFNWNIFPFHPYQEGNILKNRAPSKGELEEGFRYFKDLREIYPDAKIVAIGKKCKETLDKFEIPYIIDVRHPSNGGAAEFRSGLAELSK